MSTEIPQEFVNLLKVFVAQCQKDPSFLHENPKLAFYKDFLESWGATVPSKPTQTPETKPESPDPHPAPQVDSDDDDSASISEDDAEESEPELELEDLTVGDDGVFKGEEPKPSCGDIIYETTQANAEDPEKLEEQLREETDKVKQLALLNQMIGMSSTPCATLLAKRAELLLKEKCFGLAVKDCESALKLNPDLKRAYKTRGLAFRALGDYEKAYMDISTAMKIDYDDDLEDIEKFLRQKMSAVTEQRTKQRVHQEQKAIRQRQKAKAKAQKEYERQKKRQQAKASCGNDCGSGGCGGMPGGMPFGAGGMPFSAGGQGGNPFGGTGGMPFGGAGMAEMMKNPKIMAAMLEIAQNPASISKYLNDPEVMSAVESMSGMFGQKKPQEV